MPYNKPALIYQQICMDNGLPMLLGWLIM